MQILGGHMRERKGGSIVMTQEELTAISASLSVGNILSLVACQVYRGNLRRTLARFCDHGLHFQDGGLPFLLRKSQRFLSSRSRQLHLRLDEPHVYPLDDVGLSAQHIRHNNEELSPSKAPNFSLTNPTEELSECRW